MNRDLKLSLVELLILSSLLITLPGLTFAQSWYRNLENLHVTELITTPGDHQSFIRAISSPSTRSIKMSMFHLTDTEVIQALETKAKDPAINIQIILDRSGLKDAKTLAIAIKLKKSGIHIRASNPVFNITHTKYMLINNTDWFVTTINLTTKAATTVDVGIRGDNPDIFKEILSVFRMDFKNGISNLSQAAQENPIHPSELSSFTPALSQPNLVWSPTNSSLKIVQLLKTAQKSILLTVENLRYQPIQKALINAVARGVEVKVIVPQDDLNKDPNYNLKAIYQMQNVNANGKLLSVQTRLMPGPSSAQTPYMHMKMILVDDLSIFLGSENFSVNSLISSRELGIIFKDQGIAHYLTNIFMNEYWPVTILPPLFQAVSH